MVAGGTAMSRVGQVLHEFLPVGEMSTAPRIIRVTTVSATGVKRRTA